MEILQINTQISLEWLIGSAITVIGIVGAAWLSMKLNVATIMVRITQIEKDFLGEKKALEDLRIENKSSLEMFKQENKEIFLRIENKLDRILEKQGEQSIELANKQDKKTI